MPVRWLATHRLAATTLALVLLGLLLRSYHYLRQAPVWHDEAALLVNVLDKDYPELLGPLLLDEAAPPLFLWLERTAYLMLGDSPLAWRLVPFLASCGALLLMVYVARQTLTPAAVPWAVLLFAFSEQLLWHACEAKPYGVDVFVAVLSASLYCALRGRPLGQQLLAQALAAPFAILASYPGVFLYGGLLVTFGLAVLKERRPTTWLLFALLTAVVFTAFTYLVLGPAHAQQTHRLVSAWTGNFADWDRPWTVQGWAFVSFLEVCRYCCKPLGETLAGLLVIGGVSLYRNGRRDLLLVLAVPILLALFAALAHRYPFGGVRVMVYAAPAVVLLIAAGVPPTLAWLGTRYKRIPAAVVVGLLLLPVALAAKVILFPWPVADPAGAAEYVEAHRQPSDQVIGNDWTHFYYFHHLGSRFIPSDQDVPPKLDDRVWLVVTSGPERTTEDRVNQAYAWTPPDWTQRPVAEFSYTTVVLASRP
jgi:hypothetical protein